MSVYFDPKVGRCRQNGRFTICPPELAPTTYQSPRRLRYASHDYESNVGYGSCPGKSPSRRAVSPYTSNVGYGSCPGKSPNRRAISPHSSYGYNVENQPWGKYEDEVEQPRNPRGNLSGNGRGYGWEHQRLKHTSNGTSCPWSHGRAPPSSEQWSSEGEW